MKILNHLIVMLRQLKSRAVDSILRHRVQYHNPTLKTHYTVLWNYGYNWLDSVNIGKNCVVMPYCEIVVYKHNKYSSKEGKLIMGDHSVIATGTNIRAAGGTIKIGKHSGIGELCVLVAANHSISKDKLHLQSEWDENKTDVIIGDNVWVGANSTVLPGVTIGDNSVIGAGSVVNKCVPANEIWGGVPARKIADLK